MSSKLIAVCFGEVLWDVFPDHEKIGGAPLNVALRMQSLGIETSMVSRIGDDHLGREILSFAEDNGLETSCIQVDREFGTGVVNVKLDEKGSATYTIVHPVAWDKIELTDKAIAMVKKADAFVFGSLVCRDPVSRDTLLKLLPFAKFKIFDINLRPPHYTMDRIIEMMRLADFVKCNDEELEAVCKALGIEGESMEEQIRSLVAINGTPHFCVTRGSNGAVLLTENKYYEHSGFRVQVKDTVGAGDSFLGALTVKLLENEKIDEALAFACAMGAMVAGQEGANPGIDPEELADFRMYNAK